MSGSYLGLLIAFIVLSIAFGVTYYTNSLLLEQNTALFDRLKACENR